MDTTTTTVMLGDVVTSGMLQGVLDQVIDLLPVILPVMITYVGLRKGISFVMSMLHSA